MGACALSPLALLLLLLHAADLQGWGVIQASYRINPLLSSTCKSSVNP